MPNYSLELELYSVLNASTSDFEIYADGVLLTGYSSTVDSSGSSISIASISYGGSLPSSLEFRFTDAATGSTDQIEIRSVMINDRYVNTGNYLSTATLNHAGSSNLNLTGTEYLFDMSAEPAASEFTTGATRVLTAGDDWVWEYNLTTAEIFDALGGDDRIFTGSGDDKIAGGAGNDYIRTGAGDDLVNGGADNDVIHGDAGNDRLYGGTGNDRLRGGADDDELHGGAGNDRLNGNAGDDVLTGGDDDDMLGGGAGEDFLYGDDGNDILIGGGDNDTIDGGADDDLAYGGSGDDQINGGSGIDILIGDGGDDTISGDAGDDRIYGRDDDDTLYGGTGDDKLLGGDGNDSLSGDAGDDILDGGADTDTVSYMSATGSVEANLGVENKALQFAGGNDSVHLSGLGLNTASGSKVTVEFWMEWDGTNNMMPFGFNTYDLWLINGAFGFNNGSSLRYGISSAGLANTPVHVAAVFTDSDVLDNKLYINGVEQTLTIRGGSVNNGNAQITSNARISGWATNNNYKFDGHIDDLRIWNEERTEEEINQFMNYSITTPETDLEANYTFESIATGAGGVEDISGNANHGTLSGMGLGHQVTWNNSGVSNGYGIVGGDNDIIQNVENLIGSDYNDILEGDRNDNTIEGRGGNDIISGEDGDDTVIGGDETAAAFTNLIVNGGFEDTSNGTGNGSSPPDWTTISTGWGVYNFGGGRGSEGSYSMPLGGWGSTTGGGVLQTVATTAGQQYDLIFDGGVSFGNGGTLQVLITDNGGGTILTEDILSLAADGMEQHFFSFEAADANTTVSFQLISHVSGDTDFDIDNIRLYATNGDVLNGGDGLDTLTGGTGNDRFVFETATAFNDIDIITDFDTTERDVLDLSDLITSFEVGINPLQDTLTDYIQITDDGTDSSLFVDVTGSGTFGAATQIATLTGVTGLTDELALFNSSNIYL